VAQKSLSKGSTKIARSIVEAAESICNLARKVDDKRVRELVRRQSIPIQPDGYPSSSMPERTSGGGTSDPTLGTVLAQEKNRQDPIAKDLRMLYRDLEKAESHVRSAVARLDGIDQKVDEQLERRRTNPCSICLELPAEKAGWCTPHYTDWVRHGKPDRAFWEMWKRRDVNSDGELLLGECPAPSPGNTAIRGPHRDLSEQS
jgi:hypothetical protein